MASMLSELVSVGGAFQRAMRLDRDYSSSSGSAVQNWVPQGSATNILEMMATHISESNQRAFTWTGPYGSGKSSLALMLCSLVGGDAARDAAISRLNLPSTSAVLKVFAQGQPWTVWPVTGRQTRLIDDLAAVFHCERSEPSVVSSFRKYAEALSDDAGLLLIIDELGKYLEAEKASENAYLLQELAETANRSGKKAVLVGILHQAVDVYASRMPKEIRDEWEKVQGRFIDMPLLSNADEVIELLGRAIEAKPHESNPKFDKAVSAVAHECAALRKGGASSEARMVKLLGATWPLNPVTTMLLGPVSRRKFSQNERSIYSFLCSRESEGFLNFLENNHIDVVYSPSNYWDYLKLNFETSILSTSDSHRWVIADDAVERTERKGTAAHVRLTKTLALLDLFRMGAGIGASLPVLAAGMLTTEEETARLLNDLINWKIAIGRRHINAYGIFAGSDFNLEEALAEAISKQNGVDPRNIKHLLELPPIVARSLYTRLGTLRWFDRVVLPAEQFDKWLNEKQEDDGATGAFVLLVPEAGDVRSAKEIAEDFHAKYGEKTAHGFPFVLGVPEKAHELLELITELQALGTIAKLPDLEGDETARKEVSSRISQVRDLLTEMLNEAFTHACWIHSATNICCIERQRELNRIANSVAENLYPEVPIIRNELINRDFTSGNITSARRVLMHRMLSHEKLKDLGYDKFPPDYALYLSILKNIHKRSASGDWYFDTTTHTKQYENLWIRRWSLSSSIRWRLWPKSMISGVSLLSECVEVRCRSSRLHFICRNGTFWRYIKTKYSHRKSPQR